MKVLKNKKNIHTCFDSRCFQNIETICLLILNAGVTGQCFHNAFIHLKAKAAALIESQIRVF